MKVESIAECSPWSILQYFWPALSDNWSWKPICGLFESGLFITGFTVPFDASEFMIILLFAKLRVFVCNLIFINVGTVRVANHYENFSVLKSKWVWSGNAPLQTNQRQRHHDEEAKNDKSSMTSIKERGQRSGIDTIKHHTWPRIPMDVTIRHHKREPRGQPFHSRWPQGINKQMYMKA